jgi:hypothetical protein
MATYQASKRLKAIRRQLKQMDEQYRCAIEDEEPNAATISADSSKFEMTYTVS